MFSRYCCNTNGSITDAAVKTTTVSEDSKLQSLPAVALPLEAGKIIPDAESIVLPELQKHNKRCSLQLTCHISNFTSNKHTYICKCHTLIEQVQPDDHKQVTPYMTINEHMYVTLDDLLVMVESMISHF